MEEDLFITDSAVAETLRDHFVESRLHTDAHTRYSDTTVVELQDRYADSNRAQPIYVVIDPADQRALARLTGARRDEFLPLLRRAIAARKG